MRDRTITLPKLEKYNQYNQSVAREPKKNLQVYIPQTTFKKMLKKMDSGMTLSDITTVALEEYL